MSSGFKRAGALTVACIVVMNASIAFAAPPTKKPKPPPAPTVAPSPVAAPPVDPSAEGKRKGDEALVNGRPAEALAFYREAYAARPDPALAYNMGRALQLMGDFPSALEQLELFESTASPDVKGRVPGLATLLADVRRNIATVAISCDVSGATVRLDDRVIGTTPMPASVRVKPGPASLVVSKEGYFDFHKAVTLPGAGLATFDVKLASKQTTSIVTVTSPVVGAFVAVDGKPEGTVPTDVTMGAGSHQIALTHPGYRPAQSALVVSAGERKTLDVSLEREAPITKKWWFWTGIGVVAAGAVVTIIALTTEKGADRGTVAPGQISAGLKF